MIGVKTNHLNIRNIFKLELIGVWPGLFFFFFRSWWCYLRCDSWFFLLLLWGFILFLKIYFLKIYLLDILVFYGRNLFFPKWWRLLFWKFFVLFACRLLFFDFNTFCFIIFFISLKISLGRSYRIQHILILYNFFMNDFLNGLFLFFMIKRFFNNLTPRIIFLKTLRCLSLNWATISRSSIFLYLWYKSSLQLLIFIQRFFIFFIWLFIVTLGYILFDWTWIVFMYL